MRRHEADIHRNHMPAAEVTRNFSYAILIRIGMDSDYGPQMYRWIV